MLTSHETNPVDQENIQPNMATSDSTSGNFIANNLIWFIIGGAVFIIVVVIFIIVVVKKKKRPKYINVEAFTEDQEVK